MMKKILFLSLVICSVICFSCNNKKINNKVDETTTMTTTTTTMATTGSVFKLNQEIVLKDKESAALDSKDLVIEVLEINDSRCPVGTNCVRAGEVKFSLLLKSKGKELKTVLSHPVKGYQLKGSVSFEGYNIELTGANQNNDKTLNTADLGGILMITNSEG